VPGRSYKEGARRGALLLRRLRYCPQTRAYLERRTTEGKTKREIIRCLKRYLAREIHRTLTADLADLGTT
jgi:transposase